MLALYRPNDICAACIAQRETTLEKISSILVVEDEVLILHMIESGLEEGGFSVMLAASADRAVELLDAQKPPFCAVITDINLGRAKSGWDVAKHARELAPDIAVIYVSGHGAYDWASHGLPKSVMITKPFAIAQLLTAVSHLLNSPRQG
ncbi:MAG: response regulator [Tardiphaga sp.]|nr:response regulator [Tardiphaga sp.]